jgi:hypothetical protein
MPIGGLEGRREQKTKDKRQRQKPKMPEMPTPLTAATAGPIFCFCFMKFWSDWNGFFWPLGRVRRQSCLIDARRHVGGLCRVLPLLSGSTRSREGKREANHRGKGSAAPKVLKKQSDAVATKGTKAKAKMASAGMAMCCCQGSAIQGFRSGQTKEISLTTASSFYSCNIPAHTMGMLLSSGRWYSQSLKVAPASYAPFNNAAIGGELLERPYGVVQFGCSTECKMQDAVQFGWSLCSDGMTWLRRGLVHFVFQSATSGPISLKCVDAPGHIYGRWRHQRCGVAHCRTGPRGPGWRTVSSLGFNFKWVKNEKALCFTQIQPRTAITAAPGAPLGFGASPEHVASCTSKKRPPSTQVMSGGGSSQDAVTAVRRSNRNNKGADYGSSMEVIEETDGDEDLEVYSSGTEGPISVVHARRAGPDGNGNLDLDGPPPERRASEDGGVDEHTERRAQPPRHVMWIEHSCGKNFWRTTSSISQGRYKVVVRSGRRTKRLA